MITVTFLMSEIILKSRLILKVKMKQVLSTIQPSCYPLEVLLSLSLICHTDEHGRLIQRHFSATITVKIAAFAPQRFIIMSQNEHFNS